jgi:hypothetical protein
MVPPPSHQTIKLSAGSHRSPEDGACVVELSSMLEGLPFSDRPESVCPALREFLHGYNDGLPDELRQDLYGLASAIAGSRSPARTTAWRARLCTDWGLSLARLQHVGLPLRGWTLHDCALAGRYCAGLAASDGWAHRRTVAFLTWLATPRTPNRPGQPPHPSQPHRRNRPHGQGQPHRPALQPAPLLGEPNRLAPVARV